MSFCLSCAISRVISYDFRYDRQNRMKSTLMSITRGINGIILGYRPFFTYLRLWTVGHFKVAVSVTPLHWPWLPVSLSPLHTLATRFNKAHTKLKPVVLKDTVSPRVCVTVAWVSVCTSSNMHHENSCKWAKKNGESLQCWKRLAPAGFQAGSNGRSTYSIVYFVVCNIVCQSLQNYIYIYTTIWKNYVVYEIVCDNFFDVFLAGLPEQSESMWQRFKGPAALCSEFRTHSLRISTASSMVIFIGNALP